MNQEECLTYLIRTLTNEPGVRLQAGQGSPDDRMLLRSLMNIRMPGLTSDGFLAVQDAYLKEEALQKGIISLEMIPSVSHQFANRDKHANRISLWQGDITSLEVDAIVNAANGQMLGCFSPCHNCIDNAIHSAAGMQLREACYEYMSLKNQSHPGYEEPTGTAVVTAGYNLPAKYVIHTVGPIVQGELSSRHMADLRRCYTAILKAAVEHDIRTLAFCCISTGVYQFPNAAAAKIAVQTVREYLDENSRSFDRIIFNVFKDEDERIYRELLRND